MRATYRDASFAYSNSASLKVAFELRGFINHVFAGGVMCICNIILFTTSLPQPGGVPPNSLCFRGAVLFQQTLGLSVRKTLP